MNELLSEWESKALLGARLPRPRELLSRDCGEALEFAARVGGPVVAKASGVAHKSDARLVRLGLDATSLAACWDELAAAGDGAVLVAEQITAELELIVGGLRDPQFGALVSVGLGGVAAEVFDDVVFVLAPPERGELDAALAELRAAPLLAGHRGQPPVDRHMLGVIVDSVAELLAGDSDVVEIDCNPVMVAGGRPVVVDALVVRARRGGRDRTDDPGPGRHAGA